MGNPFCIYQVFLGIFKVSCITQISVSCITQISVMDFHSTVVPVETSRNVPALTEQEIQEVEDGKDVLSQELTAEASAAAAKRQRVELSFPDLDAEQLHNLLCEQDAIIEKRRGSLDLHGKIVHELCLRVDVAKAELQKVVSSSTSAYNYNRLKLYWRTPRKGSKPK